MRSWPVVGSCPTAASAKPNIIDAIVFMGGSLPMPTKLQNVSNWTAKSSAGPNASAKSATIGARKVRMTTAKKAPMNDEVKGAGSDTPERPCCAPGKPAKAVANDHGTTGIVNRKEEEKTREGGGR